MARRNPTAAATDAFQAGAQRRRADRSERDARTRGGLLVATLLGAAVGIAATAKQSRLYCGHPEGRAMAQSSVVGVATMLGTGAVALAAIMAHDKVWG